MTPTLFPLDSFSRRESAESAVSRATGLYNVHAYHTKVPVEGIEPHIRLHTEAGQVVLDPYCGSGMTGVAARQLGRRALLSDLSPAAVHIARNYTTGCEPGAYMAAVRRIRSMTLRERTDLYGTTCHVCGSPSVTAYVVWSDVRRCPCCAYEFLLWDQRASGLRRLTCPGCGASYAKSDARIVTEVAVEVAYDCSTCGRKARKPLSVDIEAAAIRRDEIPYWYPNVPFGSDREMWRAGHTDLGIFSVADFYSPRNLRALGALWAAIQVEADDRLRDALRFTFTAIANRASRRYQWNQKRPTNVLGGTLYVSSLRYEFNVFGLWDRKVAAARRFFTATSTLRPEVRVVQASATALPYASASVDYCFTDPPFGANIIYSDCSLLWEAWLGALTDKRDEAIMNQRGKGIDEYVSLMLAGFQEIHRVLMRGAAATIVFQNTNSAVWEALISAAVDAGFAFERVEVLHKAQPSFKGVKAQVEGERVAASDIVLTLRRDAPVARVLTEPSEDIWQAVRRELQRPGVSKRQRTSGHLYAVAVASALNAGVEAGRATFAALETWLAENCERVGPEWRLREVAGDV